jgi:hypothetical protein
MGIRHNPQSCAPSLSGDFGAVLHKQSSNSTTLHAEINKQSVQFGSPSALGWRVRFGMDEGNRAFSAGSDEA